MHVYTLWQTLPRNARLVRAMLSTPEALIPLKLRMRAEDYKKQLPQGSSCEGYSDDIISAWAEICCHIALSSLLEGVGMRAEDMFPAG